MAMREVLEAVEKAGRESRSRYIRDMAGIAAIGPRDPKWYAGMDRALVLKILTDPRGMSYSRDVMRACYAERSYIRQHPTVATNLRFTTLGVLMLAERIRAKQAQAAHKEAA